MWKQNLDMEFESEKMVVSMRKRTRTKIGVRICEY